jgi:ketosteroid isomerase-like protein
MATGLEDRILAFVRAEAMEDAGAFESILAEDFRAVGPVGFVLNKAQWLNRYADGLKIQSYDIGDLEIRQHPNVAVCIGVLRQEVTYQGRPNNGTFRTTLIYLNESDEWMLLGMHISPMMGQA